MRNTVLAFLFASIPALAGPIGFGIRAGVPITDVVETAQTPNFGFNTNTKRYVIGPTIELRLPFGLGVHVDALYRRFSVEATAGGATASESFGLWQFPVMGKYRFGAGPWRPFVSAGPSFSKLTGPACVITGAQGGCLGPVLKDSGTGFAIGAGLDLAVPVIHVIPEFRFTRLGADFLESTPAGALGTNRNQYEFLVGITF